MYGYVKEKSTQNIISYFDLKVKPQDTDIYEYIECEESEKPALTVVPLTDEQKNEEIYFQIDSLDKKRVRAMAEPSVKDSETGETWLEYYNSQIAELRSQLI